MQSHEQTAYGDLLYFDHAQSPKEGVISVWESSQRLLSQRGLALIALLSFGQTMQTKRERALQSSK